MSFFSTFKAKVRAMCLLLGALLVAFVVSGCGNSSDDYVGTWMGINEIGYGNSKVYEFDIELDRNGIDYIICVTQKDYDVSINHSAAEWRSTMPHYFSASLNNNGDLVSDIGVIRADHQKFRLIYGNIFLVRKAKNTELKFKYVVRRELEERYPGIVMVD